MSTILIAGANRGIGLEMCRQYRARGEVAIAVCRKRSCGLEALDVEIRDSRMSAGPTTCACSAVRSTAGASTS